MSEPIRVLMINYKMQCAGIESFIMNMYRNIDRTKVQFDFLVHYTEHQFYDDEIESLGGKIYRLSIREDNNFVKYFRDLKRFFKEHPEYKIVHGHMESFGLFYLKAAKDAGVPVRIAHSHIAQRNYGVKGWLKSILNKGFKKYATHLFACSKIAGDFVFGENAEFSVLNNAIDVEKFAYSEEKRREIRNELGLKDEFVIGHVGRFNTQKNHTFLIEVFKHIVKLDSNAQLLLVGEGELQDEIMQKVEMSNISKNVHFLGIRKDVDKIYQAMDVFLMPSLFEGLPVSGIEAQTSGLKCILSDTISNQIAVTENIEFVSLDSDLNVWAKTILKYKDYNTRSIYKEKVVIAGYDIKKQVKDLQEFYVGKDNEERNESQNKD